MLKQYKLRFYNFRLVIFLLAISVIGIVLVGSAREDLKSKQLVGVILGLIIMVILSLMDYSWISNFQWIMYGANIVLLVILPMVRHVGLILDLSVFSRRSCRKLLSYYFLPGSLWIMKKI